MRKACTDRSAIGHPRAYRGFQRRLDTVTDILALSPLAGHGTQDHSMPGPVPLWAAPGPADVAGGGFQVLPPGTISRMGSRAAYWSRARPSRQPAVPPDTAGGEVAETALRS